MKFQIENFKIGVNENRFHFQDPETGVIFTLKKADYDRLDMAICSASANEDVCNSLKSMITEILEKYNLRIGEFEDIAPEKTYISEDQTLFVFEDFAGDGIGIRHKQSNKLIGLVEVSDDIPLLLFDPIHPYGYESALEDFFELCSDNIKLVKAGTYHGKTIVSRTNTIIQIKQDLLKCLVEGVRKSCLAKSVTEPEYEEVSENRIILKIDEFSKMKMKRQGDSWYIDESETAYPVRGLVYAIETVKVFPQLNRVNYRYTFEGHIYDVCITKKNVNKILKEAIKRRIIDLTV